MITSIDNQLSAGNIRVLSVNGNHAELSNEPRGTYKEHWFYWKFRVSFDAAGEYTFRFNGGPAIGPRGACYSTDNGLTWHWGGTASVDWESEAFSFRCDKPLTDVQFCVSIPHLQADLDRFLASLPAGSVQVGELTRTRHGRSVELLTCGNPQAQRVIVMTSRHHCQEEMATYAMEGIIRTIAAQPARFADLCVLAVPFTDKDGALEGDQGKRRTPHDHARDYGEGAIYPETQALMALCRERRPEVVMDMHCPWLRGNWNEHIYFVGREDVRVQAGIDRFSEILEEEAPACMPFCKAENIAFGQAWNTAGNYAEGNGKTLVQWASGLEWQPYCMSLEIPFANIGPRTIDQNDARMFGEALARSLRRLLPRH